MRKMKKIALAGAVLTLALGSGLVVTNFANASSDVLSGLAMNEGMSIRMNEPEGLRFSATIDMTKAEMESAGIVEVGTVLMPESQVNGTLEYNEKNGNVEALLIPTEYYSEQTDDASSWYSVLVNTGKTGEFPASFYNTPITARAYAKYGDGSYKYSANTITKSIGYVASMYYLSGNAGDEFGVIAKIASQTSQELVINAGEELVVGENDYQASVIIGGCEAEAIDGMSVAWSVEGDAVTVDQTGKVTPVKGGSATVSVKVSVEGGNEVTLTEEVSVADVSYTVANVYEYEKFTSISEGARVKNTENFVIDLATAKTADNKSVYLPTGTYTAKAVSATKEIALEYLSVKDNKVTWAAGEITYDRYDSTAKTTWSTFVGGEWNLVLTAEGIDATIPVLLVNKVITTANDLVAIQTYADNLTPYPAYPWGTSNSTTVVTVQYYGYFKLGGNIDLGTTVVSYVSTFDYNGQSPNPGFNGTFDGCGYTISNGKYDVGGLFGYVGQKGVVKNVAFVDVVFVYSGDDHWNALEGGSTVIATCFNGTAENVLIDIKDHVNSWYAGAFGTSAQLARYKNVVVYYPNRTGSGVDTTGAYFAADAFYGEKATANNFYIFTNEVVDCTTAKKYAFTAKLSETDIASAGFDTTIWDLSGDKATFVKKTA